ncbi:MAG: hypothetical protein U0787_06980 [Polyangia bacterium]
MRRDTCQATFVAGTQSAELHARRLRCLDGRLQEVAAFMNLGLPMEQVLDSAVDQSSDLTLLEPCADPHFCSSSSGKNHFPERDRLDVEVVSSRKRDFCPHNPGRLRGERPCIEVLSAAQQIDNLPLQARAEQGLSDARNVEAVIRLRRIGGFVGGGTGRAGRRLFSDGGVGVYRF